MHCFFYRFAVHVLNFQMEKSRMRLAVFLLCVSLLHGVARGCDFNETFSRAGESKYMYLVLLKVLLLMSVANIFTNHSFSSN